MAPSNWKEKRKGRHSFLRNFFHVFNFILFLSGCGLAGVAIWSLIYKRAYIVLVKTLIYSVTPWALLSAAVASLLVPFLGSCSVAHHNRCLLVLYIFCQLMILVLEGMTGGLAWVYRDRVQFDLNTNLVETFQTGYGVDSEVTAAIDSMHQEYKCCGAKTFEEWLDKAWLKGNTTSQKMVPDSCCKSMSPGCGVSYHPSNIPYTGCIHKLSEELEEHLVVVCAVSLGVMVIPLIGVIVGCWLYIKLKDYSPYSSYTQANSHQL